MRRTDAPQHSCSGSAGTSTLQFKGEGYAGWAPPVEPPSSELLTLQSIQRIEKLLERLVAALESKVE